MFKLDDNLLQELGLGTLPAVEKNKMLSHIYETLEMRVGMKLAEQMSNDQLDEFESYIDRNDEPGALKWLEANFPGYKQVVADELEKLKSKSVLQRHKSSQHLRLIQSIRRLSPHNLKLLPHISRQLTSNKSLSINLCRSPQEIALPSYFFCRQALVRLSRVICQRCARLIACRRWLWLAQ